MRYMGHITDLLRRKAPGQLVIQFKDDCNAGCPQCGMRVAKGANPLSGLPGNVSIEKETKRRADSGMPAGFTYADIDNFKMYNDTYGFEKGDKVILLMTKILSWAVKRHGGNDSFLGHIGGDDFVMITSSDQAERVCMAVCRCFERLASGCYSYEDRRKGYIEGLERNGKKTRVPLMTISLAIIDCPYDFDLRYVGERSAEMKKYAKSKSGNSYVRDRRQILGSG